MDASSTLNLEKGYYLCSACDSKYQKLYYSSTENFENMYQEFIDFMAEKNTESNVVQYVKNELSEKCRDILKLKQNRSRKKYLVDNALLTTGYNFEGYEIVSYHGIVTGNIVIGTGFLSELSAGISDLFGSQSDKFSGKMYEAEQYAHTLLIQRTVEVGGNAVIGVQHNYIPFSGNMIGLSVIGTAVSVVSNIS